MVSDVLGQDHIGIPSSEHVSDETYHIVIKTLVKSELIGLHHDGHVYQLF